jgi:MYXO-CTERM domain-containing protein
VFSVALWQDTGTQNVAALSLITYDVIPEPSAGILAVFGLASLGALHALRMRRRSAAVAGNHRNI